MINDESPETAHKGPGNEPGMVFEAVNGTLKEWYVGISALPITIEEIERRYKEKLPKPIAHWLPEHKISYRCVESNLAVKESLAFLDSYATTVGEIGWKVITD